MAGITYTSILDGITDSCALTEPLSSLVKPPKQKTRIRQDQVLDQQTIAQGTGSNQDLVVEFGTGSFSTGVTIDLKPYQDAVAALKFDGYKDSVYSTTLSSIKATPSVEYKLGITNAGTNIGSVGILGAISVNSNRVVINASKHMAMMFGQEGVAIASPSRVNIDAGETITLAAQESLFIGLPNKGEQYTKETQPQISLKAAKEGSQKGDPTVDKPYEPLVLGIKLANLLEDILFVLKNAQGVDAWSPVRFNATAQAELSLLANRIPEILSTYAYVDGISHGVVDQTVLNTIKQAQASTPDLASPTKLTGSFAGSGVLPGATVNGDSFGSAGAIGQNTVVAGGGGYVNDSRTQAFVAKFLGGIYPAKMYSDGTFVIDYVQRTNEGPRSWLIQNPSFVAGLVNISIPLSGGKTTTQRVHPQFAKALEPAFAEIIANGGREYIKNTAGALAVRNVTGGTRLTNHSYGFAFDINATEKGFSYATKEIPTKWDLVNQTVGGKPWTPFQRGFYEKVGSVMMKYGITWLYKMDPMHFSIHE